MRDSYVAVSVLVFKDGSGHVLKIGEGSKEDCDVVCSLIPAVAYNGEKPVERAFVATWPRSAYEELTS